MPKFLDVLFGRNLPKKGKVLRKEQDGPRYVDYPDPVGRVWINKEPIYWLVIKVGKSERAVPVTKAAWNKYNEGDDWAA
jgi:hypothetical protein